MLLIQRIHQACYQFLARSYGIFEIYLVDVGDVEADAFGVWGIIEHERKDGLVHVPA